MMYNNRSWLELITYQNSNSALFKYADCCFLAERELRNKIGIDLRWGEVEVEGEEDDEEEVELFNILPTLHIVISTILID